MNHIRRQLHELLNDAGITDTNFNALWCDFEAVAKALPPGQPLPKRRNLPKGYQGRFKRLWQALSEMTPAEWSEVRREMFRQGARQEQFDPMADVLHAVCDATNALVGRKLNARGGVPAWDVPMQLARALFERHVSLPITTSETGTFAQFAALLFAMSDPNAEPRELKRRIVKCLKSSSPWDTAFPLDSILGRE